MAERAWRNALVAPCVQRGKKLVNPVEEMRIGQCRIAAVLPFQVDKTQAAIGTLEQHVIACASPGQRDKGLAMERMRRMQAACQFCSEDPCLPLAGFLPVLPHAKQWPHDSGAVILMQEREPIRHNPSPKLQGARLGPDFAGSQSGRMPPDMSAHRRA